MNKLLKIILIQQWLIIPQAYITSDYGFAGFDGATWTSVLSSSYTAQVNFKEIFQNIPQVMTKKQYSSTGLTISLFGYQASISEITTTYKLTIISFRFQNFTVNQLRTWMALDDLRFEIVNVFNQANPTLTSVPLSNKNAKIGFIAFTSYGGQSPTKFVLSIDSITETDVNVKITGEALTDAPTNLLNIGYSIVLGPEGAFEANFFSQLPRLFKQFRCQILLTNKNIASRYRKDFFSYFKNHTYKLSKSIRHTIWIYYSLYFSYSTTIGIRMRYDLTHSGDQASYCLCCWGPLYDTYTKYGHQTTTINLILLSLLPILIRKIRVSSANILENVNTIQVSIPELNKNYNSITNELLEIPSTTQNLTINIKVKCILFFAKCLLFRIKYNFLFCEILLMNSIVLVHNSFHNC